MFFSEIIQFTLNCKKRKGTKINKNYNQFLPDISLKFFVFQQNNESRSHCSSADLKLEYYVYTHTHTQSLQRIILFIV